jgi:ankyrin repeat protein
MKNALLFLLVCLLPLEVSGQQEVSSGQTALAFTHATVIDATGAPAKTDMTVVVKDDRIEALGKTGILTVPENARVVNAAGKFLIPGLWDMHVHPYDEKNYLALFTANGVTGVRVMRGEPVHHKWRQEISSGKLIGPRMVIASPLLGGPLLGGEYIVVSNEEEGRQFIRKVKEEGADFIKVYSRLSRDAYFAIADEAKKQGIPFAGHVPFSVSAAETSDAGQQSIEHCYCVSLACATEGEEELIKKVKETLFPDPSSGRARAKLITDITYSEKKAAELFSRFVKNDTWVCPTLMVWHGLLVHNEEGIANDPRFKYIPLSIEDKWRKQVGVHVAWETGEWLAYQKRSWEKKLALVGAIRRAGVGLLAGTDTITAAVAYNFPGFSLHDELVVFVQAGLSPMEALQTATYNAAKCMGLLDSMRTIEQGKIADLVLLDADPLQDISNTRRIAAVVLGGKIFDKTALQKMLIQVEAQVKGEDLHQVKVEDLHQATAAGEIERVKLLISEGVDVNVKNDKSLTSLHFAAVNGHKEIVELLLEHGADVNIGCRIIKWTAAEYAMRQNHTEIVELLISKGADISPLHFAIYMKDEARARSLIEGGADVSRRTPNGTSPLNRAAGKGLKDIVELLIARGADVNAGSYWDWTPLHGAAEKGYKDIVELLIAKDANVNARDGGGRTPLWYSQNEGHTEIVELLRKHGAKE